MTKLKILYVTHIKATFIEKDTAFLKEKYELIPLDFHAKKDYQIPFLFIKQFFQLLLLFPKADLVFCQFAGYHSFFPSLLARLFQKPTIIIACGTDCYSYPSIDYGNFRKTYLSFATKKTYEWCTHIVPVDETLILNNSSYYNVDYPQQGIKFFCPEVTAKFVTIYNGYDSSIFKKNTIEKKPKTFITIGKNIDTLPVFYRKGIDLILAIAPKFPDCSFVIVGMNDKSKMPIASGNVKYIEFLPQSELAQLLNESQFYFQLSIAEGFPNALCEAMLCECVPIGSDVAGIPKIMGDTGFLLKKKDKNMLEDLIHDALTADLDRLGKEAKKRIIENFSLDKRKRAFYRLLDDDLVTSRKVLK